MSKPSQPKRVNLGCGHVQPPGWINVDASNRAKLAHYLSWLDRALVKIGLLSASEFGPHTTIIDVRKRLPFRDDSIHVFYCGELAEHLKPEQCRYLIGECVRALEPGGILRVCTPDLHDFWSKYIKEVDRVSQLPQEQWSDARIRAIVRAYFRDICVDRPWVASMGHFHKWGYDEVQMIMDFKRARLTEVSRCQQHDSAIEGIEQVETRHSGFLIVEGRKPL